MVSFKPHTQGRRRAPYSPACATRTRSALLSLPHELLFKIATHIVAMPGTMPASSFISAKPAWRTSIAGLANASRDTRDAALRAWFRVLVLRDEDDWGIVLAVFSAIRFSVREIYIHSRAVSPSTPPDALLSFPALLSAHINAHNDVTFDPRIGYTYYTLLPHIPRGLKRLAIAHAHAPDGERLESLVCASKTGDGIQLEELRLGRCTLFDCATEGCSYWPAFPHDHDAYFSDDGAVEYAVSPLSFPITSKGKFISANHAVIRDYRFPVNDQPVPRFACFRLPTEYRLTIFLYDVQSSIAQDLLPLRSLRVLHLGVYLTPHIALSTHQHHHAPFMHHTALSPININAHPHVIPANGHLGPVNHLLPLPVPVPPPHHLHLLHHPHHRAPLHCPSLWASPCAACQVQFGPATKVAEHAACTVLGGMLPWIEEVSWAGYFERYGKGVSRWVRGRDDWVRR
ncbi:hypothetical protein FRC09_005952 [Ceratobasidium sp. 395]|nr:hypothetical protein FRC09_005952 [Ceratobasidium sp. 395]